MGSPLSTEVSHHDRTPRVLHFVTGGFTGATQVAVNLVAHGLRRGPTRPLLVLRRKRHTDPARVAALRARGLPLELVPAWPKWRTIVALRRVCRAFRPDVLIAHGYSEHLWGRYAGWWAGVPRLIHGEQGWERYPLHRRWQSRWLAQRTTHIVACSQGLRERLVRLGLPADRVVVIPNAIRLEDFAAAERVPFRERVPGIVMPARFASSKDHPTLLRAISRLRRDGLRPPVLLAGHGRVRHRRHAETIARDLGLGEQVQFLGRRDDLPALLMRHQICVLATWREGLPLALIEGMAAGCAVVGSAIPGVRELIDHGRTGILFPPGDDVALEAGLARLLRDPAGAAAMAAAACERAHAEYGVEQMVERYERLCGAAIPAPATTSEFSLHGTP